MEEAFDKLLSVDWPNISREEFVKALARYIPPIWQAHPFREGNTRTVVMLLTLFVESYGYFFDKDLLAVSAGYVRNAFVMACLGEHSEYEHLERILLDAVCTEPIEDEEAPEVVPSPLDEKYKKYQKEPYKPSAHIIRED